MRKRNNGMGCSFLLKVVNFYFTIVMAFLGLFLLAISISTLFIISYILFVLLCCAIWFNVYHFTNEGVIIVYPFRFRKIVVPYNDIIGVVYMNKVGRFNDPVFHFIFRKNKCVLKPGNELFVFFQQKRKTILKHLESKGVPIKVESDFKED